MGFGQSGIGPHFFFPFFVKENGTREEQVFEKERNIRKKKKENGTREEQVLKRKKSKKNRRKWKGRKESKKK